MTRSILSWNVAGLRAMLKKENLYQLIHEKDFDIICLQETKATETQVELTDELKETYPHRYWNSTDGTTQRKGLSGTTIWCKSPPIKFIETPGFDVEGRIVAIEFDEYILVNVYVPNSQKLDSPRFNFRSEWNEKFLNYLTELKTIKNVIVCGDLNVAHLDLDISKPKTKKNKVPGFFDFERTDVGSMIKTLDFVDVYRCKNPYARKSTYWSNFLKDTRSAENGWGIDYFLISRELFETKDQINIEILSDVYGSDHCPIVLNHI
jgi:exodeoxyribonuclease-3|tara:strand:+ start:3797 stop:4588 length:792 start_codon:yes stop_codon:yes gene_type:complete